MEKTSSYCEYVNTIGMLAQAIVDLENNQLSHKLVKPIDYQFEYRCWMDVF